MLSSTICLDAEKPEVDTRDEFDYGDCEPLVVVDPEAMGLGSDFEDLVTKMIAFEDEYGIPIADPEHYEKFGVLLFLIGRYDTAFRFFLTAAQLFDDWGDTEGKNMVHGKIMAAVRKLGEKNWSSSKYGRKTLDYMTKVLFELSGMR